jgi:hypothetical protein
MSALPFWRSKASWSSLICSLNHLNVYRYEAGAVARSPACHALLTITETLYVSLHDHLSVSFFSKSLGALLMALCCPQDQLVALWSSFRYARRRRCATESSKDHVLLIHDLRPVGSAIVKKDRCTYSCSECWGC